MSAACIYTLSIAMTLGQMNPVTPSQYDPMPNPDAVVRVPHARFTILTPSLIRMEWSADDTFEDRASQAFVNRNLPAPWFAHKLDGDMLIIRTERVALIYTHVGEKFSHENLSIAIEGQNEAWRAGMEDTGNLLGTTRTLDGISGASAMEPGLLSMNGWVVVDDSKRLVFDKKEGTDRPWLQARNRDDAIDWYYFGYGHDYKQALADFRKIAGRIPLPPRYAFGAWWSRYWAYSDKELKELVGEFREHDVPLDVLVIDMDWHLDGWTGYTWNPELFPDPEGFLKWTAEQGLKTTLNLHPADGVGKHEKPFTKIAEAMGLDPEKIDSVPFDCTDPRYMDAYFKLLHHPLEKQGIDFWWIDWQQGSKSNTPGLDPLFQLNHLHWADMEAREDETQRRPIIFSRWGGLGNHRYQIGFSGDTFCNWPSLAFQPFFTATAGNVGFAYWSHDIGGHQPGPVDPELYARWIQYGVFSPILRTHTTKNTDAERRIWKFTPAFFDAARKAYQLRYALIPYIYTAARTCYDTGLPLCRPLYYEWPDLDESYKYKNEYLFGPDMLVAPVIEPMNAASGCTQKTIWLPPGEWINWHSGRVYKGPGEIRLLVAIDEIPLFVRAGAIIPMMPRVEHTEEKPLDPMILTIFPGRSGETRVYEDDGISSDYEHGRCAWTPVAWRRLRGDFNITIAPVEGGYEGMLESRRYDVRLVGVWPPEKVMIGDAEIAPAQTAAPNTWTYDVDTYTLTIHTPRVRVRDGVDIEVATWTQEDTGLLRSGLTGQVKVLREVADAVGRDELPWSIRSILDARLPLGPDPRAVFDNAEVITSQWPRFIADVAAVTHLDEQTHLRILLRLFGLFHKINVLVGKSGEFIVRTEVSPTLHLPVFDGMKAFARISAQAPWRAAGRTTWEGSQLSEQNPLVEDAEITIDGAPCTGELAAEVVVKLRDGSEINVPIRHVFLPSINRYWIVGPFDCPFAEALDRVFPPENEPDPTATYEVTRKTEDADGKKVGTKETLAWKQIVRPIKPGVSLSDEFFIDFDDVFGGRKYESVAYALTYLHAPQDMDATLAVGSDDLAIMWLNGEQVYRYDLRGRAYTSKDDRVEVKLRKGSNTLLVKINQGGGDWGFCVHVEDSEGHPLPQVTADLEP